MKRVSIIILLLAFAVPAWAGPFIGGGVPAATETVAGISERCTDAEMTTGTKTDCDVTPANAKVELDKKATANPLATDSLWDAAGDIVQGTGANTAAKLAIGTAGQMLKVNAGATALEYTNTVSVGTINLPSSDAAPATTAGQIRHDTVVTNYTNGAISWYDGAGVRNVCDSGSCIVPAGVKGIVERIGATFDGGGAAIAVNKIAYVHIPFAVTTIDQWTVVCDVDSGATGIIITPYMDAYAADTLPTTTMCTTGTAPNTTDGAGAGGLVKQAAWDCNIAAIPADRIIGFKVTTAPTSATWCTVSLKVTR